MEILNRLLRPYVLFAVFVCCLGISLQTAQAQSFAPKSDYATGAGPHAVAAGDFNGDGKLDLAVDNSANKVGVFLNNGPGTFAAKVDYTTGGGIVSVAVGDFNGDGKPDLTAANFSSATMSILLNNGAGTFAAKVDYATGTSPISVGVGDFNLDGKPDLAVANFGSATVSVFLNNGAGVFAAKVDYPAGTNPRSVAVGDFNEDGKPDLAVANLNSNTVSVFSNDGAGVFAAKVDYPTGTNPISLAAGDFNLDGKPDLTVVNINSNTVSVFINNGAGTFAAKVDYPTGVNPISAAAGDFNLDGKPDLAAVNSSSNTASVFVNNGGGAFAAKVDYPTGANPSSVAIGDLSGDGKPDLVSTNFNTNDMSVLLNTATVQAGFFGVPDSYATGTMPQSVAVGDLNGDGKPDLAVVNFSSNTVSVFVNNGAGAFAAKVDYPTATQPNYVAVGDFNVDGKPDLAVADQMSSTVSVFINNGDGTFAAKVDYSTGFGPGSDPFSVAVGDLNGDGKPDLAVANLGSHNVSVFINNGAGTFAAKVDYPTAPQPISVVVGDFNLDGKLDLATANFSSSSVSVLINNGAGTFAPHVDYPTGLIPRSVAVGDFNLDGKPDLATANQGGNTVSVFINNGAGTFAAKVDYPAGPNPTSVAVGDLNLDGKPDLALSNLGNTVSTLANNGDGTFATRVDHRIGAVGSNAYSIAVGDFNLDGKPDLAAANFSGNTVGVLINVSGPTAADSNISGSIAMPDGVPLAGTVVQLSGTQTRKTITDANGNYRFANVETNGFYTVTPLLVNYSFSPASRSFSLVGSKTDAGFTATADAFASANPLDTNEFFVRQQYLDFLGREPDQGGLNYWSAQLYACGANAQCLRQRRIDLSAAFFMSQEFQQTGSFIYRLYVASFGAQPSYAQFTADRRKVVGGPNLEDSKTAFVTEWTSRTEFVSAYPASLSNSAFVLQLFTSAGLSEQTAAQQQQIAALDGGATRAQVLRDVIETEGLRDREYNRSFVLMQYFGYLHRDADQGGYAFWLNVLNNSGQGGPGNYRGMVCSFLTAAEYQQRFGSLVTHSNAECGQ